MDQLNLLEWSESICRKNDPATSLEAASKVVPKLAGLRLQLVEGVTRCGGTATANEAAAAVADDYSLRESIRKRAKECVTDGCLIVLGNRVCRISGNVCSVYSVTS